jgi:outer membrane cobalamin receptor
LFTRSLALSLLFLVPAALPAGVTGMVSDPSGAPVSGAVVYLLGGPARTAVSDAAGRYRFASVSKGRYRLLATAPNLAGQAVPLDYAGGDATVDLPLELAARQETVVVTAERAALPATSVASAATVLTRRDLDEMHAENVIAALRFVPGLTLAQTGSRGNVATLFARGANSSMSLVLVDGVAVNEFGGLYNFASMPIENVERIEVVRGPQSALYGSNAIGAVVQIFTRRAIGGAAFRAQAEGGSFGTARGSFGGGARHGRLAWNADLHRLNSEGTAPNDDYQNQSATFTASYDFSGAARLNYSFTAGADRGGATGPYFFDPGQANRINRSQQNAYRHGLQYEMKLGRVWQRFDAGFYDQVLNFRSAFGESRTANFRGTFASLTEAPLAPGHTLVAGLEFQRETVRNSFLNDSSGRAITVERHNLGPFVEYRYERGGRWFANAGVRVENVRTASLPAIQFGPPSPRDETSVHSANPKVSLAFLPRAGGSAKIHASAGTGLRPPDGFELAFTTNPRLKPERTTSFDIGVEQSFWRRRITADLTYFHNRYHDLIVSLGPNRANLSRWSSDNLANSRAQGLELSVAVRPNSSLRMSGHYTWLPTELLSLDGAPGQTLQFFRVGQQLIRRPEHMAAYDLVWKRGRWTLETSAVFRSSVLDVEPNFGASGGIFRNGGYVRPDAGVEIALTPEIAIYGRLRNFTDEKYMEVYGYPSLRRNFVAGMKFRWGGPQ